MTREALRTKMVLVLMVLLLCGITAGLVLVRGPIDIRNRASEQISCKMPTVRCIVPEGDYDNYMVQIIDQTTGETFEASAGEIPAITGHRYVCRVTGRTAGGAVRSDCPVNEVSGVAPSCVGPSNTPTPFPSTLPSPTVVINSPTPTGPLFQGCPINVKEIEPTICITDSEGRCLTGAEVPQACVPIREWKCLLTDQDKAILESYNLRYRLAVYEDGNIKATTDINDTRDGVADDTDIDFSGKAGTIYTCKLEVFDESGLVPVVCSHMSGRLRCPGITPGVTLGLPQTTPVVRVPTVTPPTATITTTTSTCVRSSGDLNLDGNVDTRDVNLFVQSQLSGTVSSDMDVNCDNNVNVADWTLLFSRVFGS